MKKENIDVNSLAHTKWNCKYHIVFAPKYRRKVFYEDKRLEIREIVSSSCMAGRQQKTHLCVASSIRAMPENEIPPAMRVDFYFYRKTLRKFRKAALQNQQIIS